MAAASDGERAFVPESWPKSLQRLLIAYWKYVLMGCVRIEAGLRSKDPHRRTVESWQWLGRIARDFADGTITLLDLGIG